MTGGSPDLAHVVDAARAVGDEHGRPVTLVVANEPYLPLLRNWTVWFERSGASGALVLALDDATVAAAADLGLPSSRLPDAVGWEPILIRRTEALHAIIMAGIDLVVSDIDCVWFADPVPRCIDLGADLAFGPGTFWPPDVLSAWGFVACTGFIAVRSTPASRDLFTELATRTRSDLDDQIAFNRVLRERGVRWDDVAPARTATRREGLDGAVHEFAVFDRTVRGAAGDLTVALLPETEFGRLDEIGPSTLVAHPHVPKALDKIEALRRLGLWAEGVEPGPPLRSGPGRTPGPSA